VKITGKINKQEVLNGHLQQRPAVYASQIFKFLN